MAAKGTRHLEMRQVGKTEWKVPVLGMGCSQLGEMSKLVPIKQAVETIETAHKNGITYFDTAPWYGNGMSEHRTGTGMNAIKALGAQYSVSTKVGRTVGPGHKKNRGVYDGIMWTGGFDMALEVDFGYDAFMTQWRDSCIRMGIPKVDALAIHDLDGMFMGEDHHNKVQNYLGQLKAGGMRALAELKARGDIKAAGVGCNEFLMGTDKILPMIFEMGDLDYILLAGPYNLGTQVALDELLPHCEKTGMSCILGAPYAGGILAHGTKAAPGGEIKFMYRPAEPEMVEKLKKIEALCEKHGIPLIAATLQFPLAHPRIASIVTGVETPEQMQTAVDAMNVEIPTAFWKDLRSEKLVRDDAPLPGGA